MPTEPTPISSPPPPAPGAPTPEWERAIRSWDTYPEGTEARDSTGARWTKVAHGWKADGGDTFPYPGAAYEVRGHAHSPEIVTALDEYTVVVTDSEPLSMGHAEYVERCVIARAALTAAIARSLAAATERAERDTERLDWLNGRLNWFTTQGPGHDPCYANIRERIDAARHLTPDEINAKWPPFAARAVEGRDHA